MGLRGKFTELLASGDRLARELEETIDRVKEECRAGAMRVRVVWQFFEAEREGNSIQLFGRRRAFTRRSRPLIPLRFIIRSRPSASLANERKTGLR